MKIAILGTRGIPNNYGGFEQFAQYISVGLVKKGHEVTVYSPHFHHYKNNYFEGVKIVKIKSAEEKVGAAGNFLYDYNCLKDAAQKNFNIIYEAGYATCSPFFYLLKGTQANLITNMDGLEWKRSKWTYSTKRLMKYLEAMAVRNSHYLISDNPGIQQYYKEKYKRDSFLIAYGADSNISPDVNDLHSFHVLPDNYFLLIARMEPENNIDLILQAYLQSGRKEPFLVIGNYETRFGRSLFRKYNDSNIRFLGSIYNKKVLDSLRYFCKAYLHGHSVGGTNPSLLEAMAASSFIIAQKNIFNMSVLESDALYFNSENDLAELYSAIDKKLFTFKSEFIHNNKQKIAGKYNWQSIVDQHEEVFNCILCKDLASASTIK